MIRLVGKDVLSIFFVQGINFLIPLMATAHLTRALGVYQFGVYAAILGFGNYILILSEFSFNVTGPLLVGEAAAKSRTRSLLYTSTLLKVALLIPAVTIFIFVMVIFLKQEISVAFMGALIPVTTTLAPRWFMYSIGKIHVFGLISLLSKGSWIVLVILCVNGLGDLPVLLKITIFTQVFHMFACFYLVWRATTGKNYVEQRVLDLFRQELRQFSAIVGGALLRDFGVALLALTVGPAQVSAYALADRVRVAIYGVIAPASQALFLVGVRLKSSGGIEQKVRGRVNLGILVIATLAGSCVFVFASEIIQVLAGGEFKDAAVLLRVVAFSPSFTVLCSILGVNTLLAKGYTAEYASAQLSNLAIVAPIVLALVYFLGGIGAAMGAILGEVTLTLILARACWQKNILKNSFLVK
jgi:polysaccharide transporter, PST family